MWKKIAFISMNAGYERAKYGHFHPIIAEIHPYRTTNALKR